MPPADLGDGSRLRGLSPGFTKYFDDPEGDGLLGLGSELADAFSLGGASDPEAMRIFVS